MPISRPFRRFCILYFCKIYLGTLRTSSCIWPLVHSSPSSDHWTSTALPCTSPLLSVSVTGMLRPSRTFQPSNRFRFPVSNHREIIGIWDLTWIRWSVCAAKPLTYFFLFDAYASKSGHIFKRIQVDPLLLDICHSVGLRNHNHRYFSFWMRPLLTEELGYNSDSTATFEVGPIHLILRCWCSTFQYKIFKWICVP